MQVPFLWRVECNSKLTTKQQLNITQGSDSIKAYEDGRTASAAVLRRSFCGSCGSPLFITHPLLPDDVVVVCGTIDDVPDWAPQQEYFCRSRAKWLPVVEGTEKFETM